MERRGQVTVFLILGMVIVFVVGFAFYLRSQLTDNSLLAVSENVPAPVVFYLESLLEDAVRGAVIETIGPQGGYQDPPRAVNREPTEFYGRRIEMNFQDEPVRYQHVDEFPYPTYPYTVPDDADAHPVPYYYLLGKLSIPSYGRMNSELQQEVIRRFNKSLDLGTFDGAGFTIQQPERGWTINVSINREDISAVLSWPLEVRTGDQRSVLENLSVVLPLRLNDSYALAECLVDWVVWEVEHGLPGDPTELDVIERCKSALGLDDDFAVRTRELLLDGDDKGRRFVSVIDGKTERDTGVPFEFQYMIWKCSGEFDYDDDEQKMRVCESACAYEIPEVVLLGLCTRESGCDHFDPLPTVKKSDDGGIGIMQLTGTTCHPSIADGKALDKDDRNLEDNIECGAQELKSKYGFQGRYCCPFRFLAGGEQIYHICCVNEQHRCCPLTYQNDFCCVNQDTGEPFRNLASEDYSPYPICKWQSHEIPADPPARPEPETVWEVERSPCCDRERGDPRYTPYCCDDYKVQTGPAWGWPATDAGSVLSDAYFIYGDEQIDSTGLSGITKDAFYTGPSWDGALRAYNGWGCEAAHEGDGFQDAGVTCALENYVDAVHRFGYDERETCRSIRSTPARIGGSELDGCCQSGASEQPCTQAHNGRDGWPSWP